MQKNPAAASSGEPSVQPASEKQHKKESDDSADLDSWASTGGSASGTQCASWLSSAYSKDRLVLVYTCQKGKPGLAVV